jgi:hypothetical protein
MEPSQRPVFNPAGAGGLLIGTTAAAIGVGSLIGWAAGKWEYGSLAGAVVGVPAMIGELFSTPRPEPGHVLPALVGGFVLAAALPVFLVAGWEVAGWALAAVLFAAVHVLNLLFARVRPGTGNLAGSGVQAFGLFFKSIGLLVVLVAATVSNPALGVAAAVTYALAYTAELGLSLAVYFGGASR